MDNEFDVMCDKCRWIWFIQTLCGQFKQFIEIFPFHFQPNEISIGKNDGQDNQLFRTVENRATQFGSSQKWPDFSLNLSIFLYY